MPETTLSRRLTRKRIQSLSLRAAGNGDEGDAHRVPVTFRCPPHLKHYIDVAAKGPPGREKTEVITSALELDQALEVELRSVQSQVAAYAAEHDLKMNRDLGLILAQLVKLGLSTRTKKGSRR